MKSSFSLSLFGMYASPYTRKMLSLLRYRHIPYRFIQGNNETVPKELPQPKVNLLPICYLNIGSAEVETLVDTTLMIRRFEESFEGRNVVPTDPVLRFTDYLMEDYADEWLTKAMFHYRWAYERDGQQAARILQLDHNPNLPESDLERDADRFTKRQTSRLYVVGSNETTATVIEQSYTRFLQAFEQLLLTRPFLMGQRPCAGDFAVYGQLTQLACFDPTPMALTMETAPRVVAWVRYMDDLSGLDVDALGWGDRDEVLQSLKPLLTEVGRSYVPVMLANKSALEKDKEWVETQVYGQPWTQRPFSYQGRCIDWISSEYLSLTEDERACVYQLLKNTGCEQLLHSPDI